MISSLIENLLNSESEELKDIAKNEAIFVGFLTLIKRVDDLPDTNSRFYEDSPSLYQVTAMGRGIDELSGIMAEFFGEPAKPPGEKLPANLRFDPCVKYLNGIRKDQTFFLKKIDTGSYYGALWPWQRERDKIEIHLGYYSQNMRDAECSQLGVLVKKFLSKQKLEEVSGVGGRIHGISLPSFLQMSEMEGATYTLKVDSGSRMGYLYLDGGSLIGAQYEDLRGSQAAYRIISWDNASIQIETADVDRDREIQEPLMHVMMESLKIKDEDKAAAPPPPPKSISLQEGDLLAEDPPVGDESADASPSATQTLEPMMIEDILDVEPFEKAVDSSADRQNQMSKTTKLVIAVGVALFLIASAVGTVMFLKQRRITQRYQTFMAKLSTEEALDARIVLLLRYLRNHPEDIHREELEMRLNEANMEIEKRDYLKTVADVDELAVDDQYEKRALSIYMAFLNKYPDSAYAKSINTAVDGIRQKMATASFGGLEAISEDDFQGRYNAYRMYLKQYPKATEREAVNRMLSDLGDDYFKFLEEKSASCDAKKEWADCLARCDRFLTGFSSLSSVERVKALRGALQDKHDLADLTVRAELAGDDYAYARQIYADYLSGRPDSTQKSIIDERIEALDEELVKKSAWEEIESYANNPANDVTRRIKRVETYIQNNQTGPYNTKARALLKQLQPEVEAARRARRDEERQLQLLARRKAAKNRRLQDKQRLAGIRTQVARQFREVSGRYVDNGDGTVTDRRTGLTWCQLDSYLELGRCISYRTAKIYVRQLNAGNHDDWRLPTAGELAGIYKSSPYFPATGADWYWTSDSFARGYHQVVDVVTSVPETIFSRVSKNEEQCGHVRAVR